MPFSRSGARAEAPSASPLSESLVFLRAWLRGPLRIASLVPSSTTTGRAFAGIVDFDRPGDLLELGSGTGPIARALLDAGLDPARLIMVEREPDLVAHLRRHFDGPRILQADAAQLDGVLARHDVRELSAVVSTLPIVWFPLETQAAVLDACFARLAPDGEFLQLTNQPASPLPMKKLGVAGERAARIWRNFPPSFIWRYRRARR